MRNVVAAWLGASLMMGTAGMGLGQVPAPQCPNIPKPAEAGHAAGRYETPLFKEVSVDKDLVFGEVTNFSGRKEILRLDVYAPAADALARRPVLLLIHGGGFRNGTKEQGYIVRLSQAMAKRGYVCVSVNYRQRNSPQLDWKGALHDAVDDVALGLKWIRSNADAYRLDSSRIAVVGGSAGGMIAVNLVAKPAAEAARGDRQGVFALVNLWGSPYHTDLWPADIDPCYPPTLIIHGTKDQTVAFSTSEELAARLKAAAVRHELFPLPDAAHTPIEHMDAIIAKVAAFLQN